jgi:transposase
VVERKGIPLVIKHTGANVGDITMLLEMVDAIPFLPGPDGQLHHRPKKLHGDKGYDSNKHRKALEERGIIHRLGRRRIDQGVHLGKHRWVVERTLSWLNRYRRLRVRYERRSDIHQAFLSLGCALICLKFANRFC